MKQLSDSDYLLDRQGIYHPDLSPHAVYPVPEVPPHKALDAPHHAAVPGLQGSGDPVSGAYLLPCRLARSRKQWSISTQRWRHRQSGNG